MLVLLLTNNLRSLPYLVHTNRELGVMLRGDKPLAYFAEIVGHEPECLVRYLRLFDRHVAAGRLSRGEHFESIDDVRGLTLRRLFYTLPGEEWRVESMLHLLLASGRWTRERERRFGELLGYEDWQNNYWLESHWTGA